mgnify:FL=1
MDLRRHPLRHLRDDGARSSRTWSGASGSPTPVCAEETHIQVRLATWQALEAEDLLTSALERADALKRQLVLDSDDDLTALPLAVTDNGAQMIAASTRRFMAMVAIAQHFARPATPTDQAWIESLNGTLKAEWPHLLAITDPADSGPSSTRSASSTTASACTQTSATSPLSTSTNDADPPPAKPTRTSWNKPPDNDLPTTDDNDTIKPTQKTTTTSDPTTQSEH